MSNPHEEPLSVSAQMILSNLEQLRVNDVRWRDGKAFSLTYSASDEARQLSETAYRMFSHENALNVGAFPSLKRMQQDVLDFVLQLLEAPASGAGFMTSGGTESLILVVYGALQRAIAQRGPERLNEQRFNVVLPSSAHAALEKGCTYFNIESRRVPVGADWRADEQAMIAACDENTILLVCSAPQYPQGVVDPMEFIGKEAHRRDIPFHVDACMGGMLLPFIAPRDMPWNFSVSGVTSMSVDLHKYGYSAKGAGVIVYANKELRQHQTFLTTNWLGGMYGSSGILGTKSGGPIASAWALVQYFGVDGYRTLALTARKTTLELAHQISFIPELVLRTQPDTTLLCIGAQNPNLLSVFSVARELREFGWFVDEQTPPDSLHLTVNVVHENKVDEFINDLKKAVERALLRSSDSAFEAPLPYGSV
ncbi:MAG: aminotransferase class V-fold PLP-dependent enzyme [Actinomycetes bacterium]